MRFLSCVVSPDRILESGMKGTRKGSAAETKKQDEQKKISRVAAFIFSVHGDNAVGFARRLEAESAVPDTARRITIEVERLARADTPASKVQFAQNSPPGPGR
jgi:hypothetical protein